MIAKPAYLQFSITKKMRQLGEDAHDEHMYYRVANFVTLPPEEKLLGNIPRGTHVILATTRDRLKLHPDLKPIHTVFLGGDLSLVGSNIVHATAFYRKHPHHLMVVRFYRRKLRSSYEEIINRALDAILQGGLGKNATTTGVAIDETSTEFCRYIATGYRDAAAAPPSVMS